jgi:adhesin transport system outer membrane protein
VRYTEEFAMYRLLAAMGELLRHQQVIVPAEAVALSDVESEARLPTIK